MINIFPERIERFKQVISRRQYDLTVVLENVHDPHNIGAVLRTCDSVGIGEIYVISSDDRLQGRDILAGHKSSSGSRQWVHIHYYEDAESAFQHIRRGYKLIFGTRLSDDAKSLYDLNLTQSIALVFGNEHDGLSEEASDHLNGNFIIPQHGFVKSLNISVACAVSLYESQRQRAKAGKYERAFGDHPMDRQLLEQYKIIHSEKKIRK